MMLVIFDDGRKYKVSHHELYTHSHLIQVMETVTTPTPDTEDDRLPVPRQSHGFSEFLSILRGCICGHLKQHIFYALLDCSMYFDAEIVIRYCQKQLKKHATSLNPIYIMHIYDVYDLPCKIYKNATRLLRSCQTKVIDDIFVPGAINLVQTLARRGVNGVNAHTMTKPEFWHTIIHSAMADRTIVHYDGLKILNSGIELKRMHKIYVKSKYPLEHNFYINGSLSHNYGSYCSTTGETGRDGLDDTLIVFDTPKLYRYTFAKLKLKCMKKELYSLNPPFCETWFAGHRPMRRFAACAYLQGAIYIIGGGTESTIASTRSVDRFNLQTLKWSQAAHLLTFRIDPTAVVHNGKIYVYGGKWLNCSEISPPGEYYIPERDEWRPMMLLIRGEVVVKILPYDDHYLALVLDNKITSQISVCMYNSVTNTCMDNRVINDDSSDYDASKLYYV